jgi:putative nucleotidyltransferase with HDIG domain
MEKDKILVIDDEELILDIAREILTNVGYDVTISSDGHEGIRLLSEETFSLLLTDIRMPDISGLEVIQQVRNHNKEMPIIIITGHGTLDVAIRALKLGAQGFLLKPFTTADLRSSVAEALEKTRLLNDNIRMRALMPLFEVSKEIISETDTKKLLALIVEIAVRETRADRACLFLTDEQTGKIVLEADYGFLPAHGAAFRKKHLEKLSSLLATEKKPVLIVPGLPIPRGFEEMPGTGELSSIYMPLTVRGKVIGMLFLSGPGTEHPFSLPDVELVSVLSGQAAAAIENARLYEKLEQSYLSTIVTLSGIAESKDFYTDKHMKDIAEYSVDIAQKLELPEADVENIRMAALLHDLGKVTVPDNILKKPGRLSEEEMEIIRKHPAHGAKMIESIEPMKDARDIIRHHHEYFDGSGYPDGLKGDAIPLGARIIAVADAFDAMTTNRPYRKALPMDKVVKEMRDFSGIQFDPDIVEILITILYEKGILHHE